MDKQDDTHPVDRRLFLAGTGALAMAGMSNTASAQQGGSKAMPDKRLRQMLAEFVVGFDLKTVPTEVVAHAREGFVDTVGVAIAGSHEEVSHLVAEMVKLEAAAPQCTVIGTSLRVSPQLAALANGVSTHAMDYDHSFLSGQSVAPVIPALLAVAEVNGATPAEVLAAVVIAQRGLFPHPAGEPAAQQWRRLAHHWHCRRHLRGGGLRAADEAHSRPSRQRHRHRRVARRRAAGQLRHHDQAAALRQLGAQRHDGGAAWRARASTRMPRRSKATTATSAVSAVRCR